MQDVCDGYVTLCPVPFYPMPLYPIPSYRMHVALFIQYFDYELAVAITRMIDILKRIV